MEEAAERIHSKTNLLQLTQEKQQMELSHKRARIELEKEAHNSSRDLQVSTTSTFYSRSPRPSDLSLVVLFIICCVVRGIKPAVGFIPSFLCIPN